MNGARRLLLLLLLVGLLAGCGVKTAYNNADWLAMRWINDRVSLTAEQERAVEAALDQHLAWHCASELPAYADFLQEVKSDIARNRITPATLDAHGNRAGEFAQRLLARARPSLIDLLASLNDQQVDELIESFEERNREMAEEAERSREDLQRERVLGMEKGMRRFTGRLTREQRERLQSWAAELEPTASLALQHRLEWQERFAEALAIRHQRPAFEAAMTELLNADNSDSRALDTRRSANRARTLQTFVELHRISPERQVKRLQSR
ncbi:MAG: DUF6279 family lipoprotein, partial [Xanthomonadales bacterium]|nr:DUF6279 family lipoprotein [Xanthomonadales bacterium]